jgi:Ion transport protein
VVAIRSEINCVTVLDLSPIQQTNISLRKPTYQLSVEASGCIGWNAKGQYLTYADGSRVVVANSDEKINGGRDFRIVSSIDFHPSSVVRTVFCRAPDKTDLIGVIDEKSRLTVLRFDSFSQTLQMESQIDVEPHLRALAWSPDGNLLMVGGRKKLLHAFSVDGLEQKISPIPVQGRIWDIDFFSSSVASASALYVGIALGDYTTIILNQAFEPILHISRPLTCRCLKFHPFSPFVAIGDGSGTVAVVDCDDGEIVVELDVQDRASVVEFSPVGDFLIVGTDSCRFTLYESTNYHVLQEISCDGFAMSASFSPNGIYLALGSANECYKILRLGPMLGTDLIPLTFDGGAISLPEDILQQTLFHSGDGPSLLQRHLVRGGSDNLRRVSALLHEYPKAVYTVNRQTGEGCFETVLRLQKPGMVKLFLVSLVDGTFLATNEMQATFLTTPLPHLGRQALTDIVKNYPPEFIVDIFKALTFMKVPFGYPRSVQNTDKKECGSTSFNDPWSIEREEVNNLEKSVISSRYLPGGGSVRTPAVLPLPGLGSMSLLASLLSSAPADVFDNDAMALVLRVLWENYIRRYYYFDFCLFVAFYISWIVLVEMASVSDSSVLPPEEVSIVSVLVVIVMSFNTLFAVKEIVEGRYGTRSIYWRSMWNTCDLIGIASVYAYTTYILLTGNHLASLAVCTTLCLTLKVLSYLRGFSSTGWLLSVLSANAQDVQGFLVIITTILVGFSVAFRILFAETGDENYGSLRRSFLSTFELTVMGSYDPMILFETQHTVVAVITFILAIICVVVVALNALISILSDSYARVQENAVANRRREVASLIVEYMSILPPWKRRQIEKQTTWFHTLLEVDADGSLQVHSEDWEGGLNALRNDMEEMGKLNRLSCERAVDRLKADIDEDINKFKSEVVSMLEDLVDDVKYLRKMQSQGIMNFDPKQNIVKAVRAVKSAGRKGSSALFNSKFTNAN